MATVACRAACSCLNRMLRSALMFERRPPAVAPTRMNSCGGGPPIGPAERVVDLPEMAPGTPPAGACGAARSPGRYKCGRFRTLADRLPAQACSPEGRRCCVAPPDASPGFSSSATAILLPVAHPPDFISPAGPAGGGNAAPAEPWAASRSASGHSSSNHASCTEHSYLGAAAANRCSWLRERHPIRARRRYGNAA